VTERRPPGIGFETWIDKQIREAMDRGEFDNLPGTGKPIPGQGRLDDELWWVKDYIRREGLSTEALLPTPLRLRREIERLPETVDGLRSEQAVRDAVTKLNLRIMDWLRAPSGPQVHLAPVNADDVVEQWRVRRMTAQPTTAAVSNDQVSTGGAAPRRARWWRRRARRREPG
jgi:DnaJ homologue, subfamily C, member 28, conserved domain